MQKGVTSFYRRFDFFDSEKVAQREIEDIKSDIYNSTNERKSNNDTEDLNMNNPTGIPLYDEFDPNCAVSGSGLICFGDNSGFIKFINRDLEIFRFQSHSERVTKLYKTPDSDILIALGKHVSQINAKVETYIHIWRLSDINELGHPQKIKSFPLFNEEIHELPISALTANHKGNEIAIGCANGMVLLYTLNLRNRNTHPKIKPLVLIEEGVHAVTGLHYLESNPLQPILYIITVQAIMSCHMRSRHRPIVMLDPTGGCDPNCSTINYNHELIVAKSETVHIFEREETRGEHAFPGAKKMVSAFNRYLIVVTAYLGVKRSHAHRVEVCIYDKANKYVAFRQLFDDLISIVSEWGAIYILTKKNLIKLRDKDLQEKLNEFFRNNLYEKAIQLAKSEGCLPSKIIEYYCKYGDWLYEKDDFDQAMEQYLQTIDKLSTIEPSYVIRKFLDAQKINNLTEYLAKLHESGTPTKDHTTLLLNCYTKLKDSSKLNEFINIDSEENDEFVSGQKMGNIQKYNFDISTAINVCREAGLLTHARSLAKQDGKHGIYLDILMEEASMGNKNMRKFLDALKYISRLPFLDAEKSIKRIGKTLMEREPQGTTDIIKLLCIQWPININNNKLFTNAEEFIHLFVEKPEELKNFLEYLVKNEPSRCSITIYNTLLEIYMREAYEYKLKINVHEFQEKYKISEKLIMSILRNKSKYDATHALALGKMYGIESAVIYLYEILHLYHEIISHYRDKNDTKGIISACKNFCSQDPSLWISAFTYFIKEAENNTNNAKEMDVDSIQLCLKNISKLNLLPPLMVIELLSNSEVQLSVIRDYIIEDLIEQQTQISEDEQTMSELQQQINDMKNTIENCTHKPQTFQSTKCNVCKAPLNLPTIHFMCGHSVHEKCLYHKTNVRCPTCSGTHDQIYNKQKMMQKSKGDHQIFFRQLNGARHHSNGNGSAFKTVAEFFGRGVIY